MFGTTLYAYNGKITTTTYTTSFLRDISKSEPTTPMPTRCVAAGCDTVSGKGYSLHKFPRNESVRKQWVRAVKRQRSNWDGPTSSSFLCSKHFKPECFVTDGVRFREGMRSKNHFRRITFIQMRSKNHFHPHLFH